jgi:RND family efflux transporter MFP subunit
MTVSNAAWMEVECGIIPGLTRAVMLGQSANDDCLEARAVWPKDLAQVPDELLAAARSAAENGTAVVRSLNAGSASEDATSVFAAPLRSPDGSLGAAAVEVRGAAASQHQVVLQLLGWGGEWYGLLQQEASTSLPGNQLAVLIELLVGTLEHERFSAAATTAVTEIATHLGCERVSLGLLRGRHIEVHAVSHSARIDRRSNLMRDIAGAMEEAIDQDSSVAFPPIDGQPPVIAFAQELLAERANGEAVCSTPLYSAGRCVGALTLERNIDRAFNQSSLAMCESLGALLGPICSLKFQQDRFIGLSILDSLRRVAMRLCGPRHFALKLWTLTALAVLLFFSFATGTYRVRSDATLEPMHKRVMTAPQAGYIDTAMARAGDRVSAGQVLATLDRKELDLEKLKLASEHERFSKEQRAALGSHERAKAAIASAQMKQVRSRLDLLNERLKRTQIVAPFDGVLVAGDLNQSLGAPVEDGDVLFQIAPLDAYRVQIEVDERDVGMIQIGQSGHLALTGLPDEAIEFSVTRILPISEAKDGANRFAVEAALATGSQLLRPGMQGAAKIDIGERKLLWIWTHSLVNWVRLRLWAWMG